MLSLIKKSLVQLQTLIGNEDGQAMAQTGLVFGLVAIMCLIALTAVGLVVSGNLSDFAIAVDGGSTAFRID